MKGGGRILRSGEGVEGTREREVLGERNFDNPRSSFLCRNVDTKTAPPLATRNGEVRRRIIDKIGFAVSSQLRESSVIPQLALVAAATAMPDFEGSASFGFGQPHADGAALQPWIAWQSVQEVERRVEWLVSELRWRGYKSVSLRPLGGTAR